jgi:hypothetical protein
MPVGISVAAVLSVLCGKVEYGRLLQHLCPRLIDFRDCGMNEDEGGSIVQRSPDRRETFVTETVSIALGEETDAIGSQGIQRIVDLEDIAVATVQVRYSGEEAEMR